MQTRVTITYSLKHPVFHAQSLRSPGRGIRSPLAQAVRGDFLDCARRTWVSGRRSLLRLPNVREESCGPGFVPDIRAEM